MKATILVVCPGCRQRRDVRPSDWKKRQSDYCRRCKNRIAVGLDTDSFPSGKGTKLYTAWRGMRQRCGHFQGGHAHDLKNYQQRGLEVCLEWRRSFQPFHDWAIAHGYQPGLYLDRRDNNVGYCPENCRWVTVLESNRNRRCVTLDPVDVERIRESKLFGAKQQDLARMYGVSDATISLIVNRLSWL